MQALPSPSLNSILILSPTIFLKSSLKLRVVFTILTPPSSAHNLSESKFTEQELNAQVGSALCSWVQNRGGRVPKLERLVKSEGYKAKFAGLVVIGSVIGVGGVNWRFG
ncbi:MICROTUBULE-ASSOCIATED PROTEIN TORTIFOLIA1 [Salix viminalis]|uniref:MICROTUBULE-ASSOCIATED PROTEIN TORTIFOLIA1 n=1 Tax=Salix viminalis TaxID=40686 RepID=A0A9Q0SCX5_SALVM|nr:MICROTUBULE-ASSOCIATED PROTEIN TORTIFOLIA1 [Salix viminalis]